MTAVRAHCPACGHLLRTVLGVVLIDGVILTRGDDRARLGPVQAAIIRELSDAPRGLSSRELVARIYSDEARDNPEGVIRAVKRRLNADLLPAFGLRIENLAGRGAAPAIYILTNTDQE